jgi:hypothetical protein
MSNKNKFLFILFSILLSGCALFNQTPEIRTVYMCPTPPIELTKTPAPIVVPSIESIEL